MAAVTSKKHSPCAYRVRCDTVDALSASGVVACCSRTACQLAMRGDWSGGCATSGAMGDRSLSQQSDELRAQLGHAYARVRVSYCTLGSEPGVWWQQKRSMQCRRSPALEADSSMSMECPWGEVDLPVWCNCVLDESFHAGIARSHSISYHARCCIRCQHRRKQSAAHIDRRLAYVHDLQRAPNLHDCDPVLLCGHFAHQRHICPGRRLWRILQPCGTRCERISASTPQA